MAIFKKVATYSSYTRYSGDNNRHLTVHICSTYHWWSNSMTTFSE